MLRVILLGTCLLAAPAAVAQVPPALLAGGCQGCHGVTGHGAAGIPTIAAASTRAEFVETMRAFRENARPATVMGRIARGYSEAEYAVLATHFAKPE
jgi:sulfide dehydrogenase cytochrome subunit